MADMYTPEEIQEIFQAYNDAIKSGTPVSAELAKAMRDAEKGVKGWTDSTNAAMKKLGTSAVDLTKNLYKGGNAADNFGTALEEVTAVTGLLILALGPFSLAAKVAAMAITAFGKAVNVAGKQADALFKSYQDLSKVGATTAGGIQDVFVQMQGLGYGIEELDKMIRIVSENSETFAKFSLTAGRGVTEFAESMQSLNRDPMLRALGKLPDDINAAGASFIRQSVRAGMSQAQVGDQLTAQTRKYILDLDRLQKLTGISADALAKQQEEAMAEDAYNQVMSELRARAASGDQVAQAQIEKITTTMSKLGPEMRKEFVLGIGGDVSAQQRLFMTAPTLLKNTLDETASTQQTINDLNKDVTRTVATFGPTAKLAAGAVRETFGPLAELRETMVSTQDFDARVKAAKADALMTDKSTQNMAILQLENMNARDSLQSFVQLGVHPATRALKNFAEIASGTAGVLPGKGPGGAPGGVVGVPAPGGAAPGGGAAAPAPVSPGMGLTGLRIKSGAAVGSHAESLTALARNIQDKLGGDLKHFSAFNDSYHQGTNSKHAQGMALDFTITDPSKAAIIADMVRGMPGVSKVLDEYSNPSARATGPHIHAEVSAALGGIASGPTSGYRAVLHGTEAIVPLPDGKKIPVEIPGFTSNLGDQTNLLAQQLTKLDNIIDVMRRQVDVSTKILQRSS